MELPPYFILLGLGQAKTSATKPKKCYFVCSIKIRGLKGSITLVSKSPSKEGHVYTFPKKPRVVPIYKSNLQKCVRRKLTSKAVKSAYAMMCVSPIELLRRLPIIMVEDAMLTTSFTTLVWFMMAVTKGYILSNEEVSWILGVVWEVCKIDSVAKVPHQSPKKKWWSDLSNIESGEVDLLWALEFRKSYGGMKGDILMLEGLMEMWSERFLGIEKYSALEVVISENILIDLSTLSPKNILIPAAIDQHCCVWIPKRVRETHPEFTEEEIKGAIWYGRSGINFRVEESKRYVPENLLEVWEVIEDSVTTLSKMVIREVS